MSNNATKEVDMDASRFPIEEQEENENEIENVVAMGSPEVVK